MLGVFAAASLARAARTFNRVAANLGTIRTAGRGSRSSRRAVDELACRRRRMRNGHAAPELFLRRHRAPRSELPVPRLRGVRSPRDIPRHPREPDHGVRRLEWCRQEHTARHPARTSRGLHRVRSSCGGRLITDDLAGLVLRVRRGTSGRLPAQRHADDEHSVRRRSRRTVDPERVREVIRMSQLEGTRGRAA